MNEEKSSFIKGINEQHPAAYHQLYNEYYKALVLYAINFLSSQQAAEDIVQDLFATMWEKKMRFLSLPSFRTRASRTSDWRRRDCTVAEQR